jgi:putative inorganic carbon (hco3(-)) transporter
MLYACVLLYVGLIYIRPAEIVPSWASIPFVDIVTVLAAIIGVFSLAAKPRPVANLPHDKLLLAFWVLIGVSSVKVWIVSVYLSWLAFMPVVVCYFLIRLGVSSKRQLNGLIYLLVGLNVFLAVNGILQFHTGIGLGNVTMRFDRIYGTGIFNDPNDLGMTFVMSVPLLLLIIFRPATWLILRVLGLAGLALVLVALYYTNSRGAIVGLGAVMVCYSFVKFRMIPAVIVAVVLVGVIAVAAPSRGTEIDAGESSAQSRIQSWAVGWTMLKWHPITGVGYGQYTEYHPRVAHNSFVHTFAELGLLGAFSLVGMFYWYFKGIRLIPDKDPDLASWRRALIVSAVGMLTCGWFLSRQYVPIFYVLLAIGACGASFSAPPERLQSKGTDFVWIFALTIAGVGLVYFSIRTMAIWSG